MKKLGLIGFPLSHSLSKAYWEQKFSREGISGWGYELFPLQFINELPKLIGSEPTLAGLNVTIPHKQSALKYLDELDEEATAVGAVNTISIQRRSGKTWCRGFNTDIYGFRKSFEKKYNPAIHKKALILGSGGVAKAVGYVFTQLSIPFSIVSRNTRSGDFLYNDLNKEIITQHQVIINATPLGMYPKEQTQPPLPYSFISPNHFLFDLIYNPEQTAFLRIGKEHGAVVQNGLEMLHLQADRAWEIWNSEPGPDDSKSSDQ